MFKSLGYTTLKILSNLSLDLQAGRNKRRRRTRVKIKSYRARLSLASPRQLKSAPTSDHPDNRVWWLRDDPFFTEEIQR